MAAEPREVAAAIWGVRSEVPPEARTAGTLGRLRIGTGGPDRCRRPRAHHRLSHPGGSSVDLYDAGGQRIPAEIVAYDHDSGLGLLRAQYHRRPADHAGPQRRAAFGRAAPVLSRVGRLDGRQVALASRRDYAGYWEYLLPDALFTAPAHDPWPGGGPSGPRAPAGSASAP
ncbi:MAG: hypothetical protein U1E17_08460 [Geminicoccaceae bacterium]